MKNNKIFLIAALLGTIVASCQIVEIVDPENVTETPEELIEQPEVIMYSLTIHASKGEETKALYLDGGALKTYWKNTESVTVFKEDGTNIGTLTVTPEAGDHPKTATLTTDAVNVAGLNQGDPLVLVIPRATWSYTGQKGTLEDIEENFAYATANVTISTLDGVNHTITTSDAAFAFKESFYQFNFSDGSSALSVKSFTVSSPNIVLTHSLDGTDTPGPISVDIDGGSATSAHVALRNINAGTAIADVYSFSVIANDNGLYMGDKDIPDGAIENYGEGKYLGTTVTVSPKSFAPADTGTIDSESLVL